MSNLRKVYVSTHTGDGTLTIFPAYGLSTVQPGFCLVTADKVLQTPGVDYNVLPNFTIQFITAPNNNSQVNIYSFEEVTRTLSVSDKDNITTITRTRYVSDGTTTSYIAKGELLTPDNCIVTSGAGFAASGYVYQYGADFTVSGNTINFVAPLPAKMVITILVFSSSVVKTVGGVSTKDNLVIVTRTDVVADGVRNLYSITGSTSSKSLYCLVAANGRMLEGGIDYVVSHNRVKFIKVPAAGTALSFIAYGAAEPPSVPPSLTHRVKFLDKDANLNERTLYRNYWREQILHYGLTVNYYSNLTTKANANIIYGESPLSGYAEPEQINVAIRLDGETSMFSKFGLTSDTDATCYIHHDDFQEVFGAGSEPRSGDLIEFIEIGSDRLNYPKRGPRIMEITLKEDDIPSEINNLAGHYVWKVTLKRFDYSRENNIIPELGTPEPADTGETVPGTPNPIEELSKQIFDYDLNQCSNDSVYGDY